MKYSAVGVETQQACGFALRCELYPRSIPDLRLDADPMSSDAAIERSSCLAQLDRLP